MQHSIQVIFYDGIVSKPQQAQLSPAPDAGVCVRTDSREFLYAQQDMQLIGALGKINPVIELPDEARIEFLQPQLPAWLDLQHQGMQQRIWHFERTPSLIVASLLIVVALMAGMLHWGVPFAAKQVAYALPATTLDRIGAQAEQQLDQMTSVSEVPTVRQQAIRRLYTQQVAGTQPARLLFRQGNALGANALALPHNTIVLTDELIELTEDDRELIAVLAHEQGHLVQRHTMQQVLAALGVTVLITWVTGDVSDLVSNVPYALLSLSYSRDFERQADQYAVNVLQQQQIPVRYFTDFLKRMQADEEHGLADVELLSTHPATPERIKAVEAFAAKTKSP